MDGQTFFQTLLQGKSFVAPIQFSGGDETNSFPVKGADVRIVESRGDHELGSSKLHIKNIVNFGWEHKFYPGQLVCEHMCGVYLAYPITTAGKNVGAVRVFNRKSEERILIKGMMGPIVDLSFAHIKKEVVLGCVDEAGNMFVYKVTESKNGLVTERVLEVHRDEPVIGEHRLIWCPYLSGEEEDNDEDLESCAQLLALTHWDKVEIWLVNAVVEKHGSGPLRPQDVTHGLRKISEPGGIVSDAAFSPDGSALATASHDGQVKFFQVEEVPRCLHQWSPHQGRPVTSLFFLDNHEEYQPDIQFWKYAITASDHNSELKIWTCESWACLQTIKIQAAPDDSLPVRIKAAMDSSARYLILSDIDRNLVYVLSLDVSVEVGTVAASVISVSEFTTPSSFLSFCCSFAGRRQVCMSEDGMTVVEDEEAAASRDSKEKTVVKLFLVQPKSLQECSIIFDDAAKAALLPTQNLMQSLLPSLSSLQLGGGGDAVRHTPSELFSPPASQEKRNTSSEDLAEAASKIGLMSPEQFEPSLPPPDLVLKEEEPSEEDNEEEELLELEDQELGEEEEEESDEAEETYPPLLESVRIQVLVSGNSSPSREVATILSTEDGIIYDPESLDHEPIAHGTPSPDFHSTKIAQNTSGTIFPTPPSLPPPLSTKLVTTPSSAQHLTTLESLVAELQKQVSALKQETTSGQRVEQVLVSRVEAALTTRLDTAINHSMSRLEKQLESQLAAAMNSISRLEKQLEGQVAAAMDKLTAKTEQIIHRELQASVPDAVARAMDPLRLKVENVISNKLAATDKLAADSIAKMVTSPDFQGSVAKSVTRSLQPVMLDSYKAAFQVQRNGLENSMQHLLANMQHQFLLGTKEYENALRGRLEASELKHQDELSPILRDIGKKISNLSAGQAKIHNQMDELAVRLERDLTEMVKKEIKNLNTARPLVHKDHNIKGTIQAMVSSGRLNDAFQTALSANDLSLVIFTCQLVNTTQIFSQANCPLSQSVLLSLVQQLSVDLQEDTEVKHAFLEEALINLNLSDPVTKQHVGGVISVLLQSVQNYTQANPHSKLSRNLKTLMMAANGILADLQKQQ